MFNRCAGAWSDLEKKFLLAWQDENETNGRKDYLLAALLRPDIANSMMAGTQFIPSPTDRDHFVAATVIQWLGTNVGRAFLARVLGVEIPVTKRMLDGRDRPYREKATAPARGETGGAG